jgi:hypothetical protein
VEALLGEAMILRENGSGSKKSADRFLESMGIRESELQVIARINDQEAIKNLVAQGLGISILSERAARNFCEEKRLLGFELPESAARRRLYLIYQKNYILKPYIQKFAEFVKRFYPSAEPESAEPVKAREAGLNSALREPGPICGPLERQTILRSHSRLGWRRIRRAAPGRERTFRISCGAGRRSR